MVGSRGEATAAQRTAAASAPVAGPYQALGVRPIINARGTYTIIGGNIELPEVQAVKTLANQQHAHMDELEAAAGKRLAELTGAEWGMVSAGCSAAISHATAACVAGGNPEMHVRLPDLTGFPRDEVIIPTASRNQYRRRRQSAWREDHRGRLAGVASARARAEDRDDLHHGGPIQRNGSDVHRGDLRAPQKRATSLCSWMRQRKC